MIQCWNAKVKWYDRKSEFNVYGVSEEEAINEVKHTMTTYGIKDDKYKILELTVIKPE
jgi:hypothetical protein